VSPIQTANQAVVATSHRTTVTFSRLRDLRKVIAEKEAVPACAPDFTESEVENLAPGCGARKNMRCETPLWVPRM